MKIEKIRDVYEGGYGFAYSSGWKGLGAYYYDHKTYLVVWFDDDYSCNSDDEIMYNEFMRMNILESMGELNE